MTVNDLLVHAKRLLIVVVLTAVFVPLLIYVLTPDTYYVTDDGSVTVHAKGLPEPIEFRCPQFHVMNTEMIPVGHYSNYDVTVHGEMKYVLMRGLQTFGPVSIELVGNDANESVIVAVQSKDHPIVPQAYVQIARSRVRKSVLVKGQALDLLVIWRGAANTSTPAIESVHCDGQPMVQRHSRLGVF